MSQTIRTHIKLSGMTCLACEKLVGKRVSKIEGVRNIKVNVKEQEVEIEGTRKITQEEIITIMEGTQYQVVSVN